MTTSGDARFWDKASRRYAKRKDTRPFIVARKRD